jgi:spore coat protein A
MRGWKEVFYVPAFTYARIRIRWVRPDFPLSLMNPLDPGNNINGCNEKYFHIEESEITRAPGYVYHCHILEHEDKEMMRPIMVHPSGCTNLLPWRQRF